jgi:hypothetical protein
MEQKETRLLDEIAIVGARIVAAELLQQNPEEYFRPQIEAYWRTLPITVRDPDLITDKKY